MLSTTIVHVCARCGSDSIRKNGHAENGDQRAKCLACGRTFILQPKEGLLHHSDRGCQDASEAYREHLAAWNVTPSMSHRGNYYDNAAMESFWSTLKEELVHRTRFENRAQAAGAIFDYIETFYNRERLHRALGYLSPVEFETHINLN